LSWDTSTANEEYSIKRETAGLDFDDEGTLRMRVETGKVTIPVLSCTTVTISTLVNTTLTSTTANIGVVSLNSFTASLQPACKLGISADISLANGASVTVTWDVETYDVTDMHDSSTNPTRVTIVTDGKYLIQGKARFASNASNVRSVHIYKNGSTELDSTFRDAGSGVIDILVSTVADLSATDYLEMVVYQNSGGALNLVDLYLETRLEVVLLH